MARYLLKASDEEMDCWRVAAGGPLAPWLRRVANDAAVVVSPKALSAGPVNPLREFRPDFGSRLKPDGGKK